MNVIYLDEIDSTNRELKKRALLGAPSGTVLVADRQTEGRGRMGRSFFSPGGSGIYMSILVRPVRLADAGLLTTFAAVAVARALAGFGLEVGIKWVNDLMVGGRKLCGILAEAGRFDGEDFAVIGIGINLKKTAFPPELADIAVSFEEVLGWAPDRRAVVNAILDFFSQLHMDAPQDWMDEYRRRSVTVGKKVTVLPHAERPYDAIALSVSDSGSLLVRTSDGKTVEVSSGEVSVKI